ncbi:MAG TPA: VOC family protein [Gemmatimonadaceae bacterium]|nr:VOC family protein [Gemmatimonadaceae bacterium]
MTNSARTFLGLRTAIYAVDDIERAKEWYSKAFGVEPYFDEPFYVGFNIGGFELGLDPNGGDMGAGGSTAYWGVANAEEAFAQIVAAGATVSSPVAEVGGGIKVAVVLDPFGNRIGIIQNPHFDVSSVS